MQPATVRGALLAGALLIAAADQLLAIVDPRAYDKFAVVEPDVKFAVDTPGARQCTFHNNGSLGTCLRQADCPAANVRKLRCPLPPELTGCGYEGKTLLVCCLLAQKRSDRIAAVAPSVKACASFENHLAPCSVLVRLKRADGHTTVVNGTKTVSHEFPHMAVLGYSQTDSSSSTSNTSLSWRCGGILISAQHVLTAAHCVKRIAPIVVHIGVNDLTSLTADTASDIADIVIHPEYRASRSYNDIAVIRLREPVPLSDRVLPACLWQPAAAVPESLVATGFGLIEFDGQPSPDLLKVMLRPVSADQCAGMYSRSRFLPHGIQPSQMCAGDVSGYKDTCKGDSGGPLQTLLDQQHFVVGVTSFGQGCASKTPAIYTRVSAFVEWIEQIVWPDVYVFV